MTVGFVRPNSGGEAWFLIEVNKMSTGTKSITVRESKELGGGIYAQKINPFFMV